MAKTRFRPGGGAMPIRPDEKMNPERFVLSYPGYSTDNHPKHRNTIRKIMKSHSRKKRRQHDKDRSQEN